MTEPVTVVEVGPRDGLQNECAVLSTEVKLAFVRALASAGLSRIEVAAFVRPDRVPAMADAAEVAAVAKDVVPDASALVPNRRGLDGALAAGLSSVAVFASATEGFAQANLGQSVDGSLATFAEVVTQAKQANLHVRGYVSCAFDCPYDGAVDPGQVSGVVERLLEMGCDEIAISDTIGSAVPATVDAVLSACASSLPSRPPLCISMTPAVRLCRVLAPVWRRGFEPSMRRQVGSAGVRSHRGPGEIWPQKIWWTS